MNKPIFKKILIANRGEIASRIMRSAKKMGISTVAVYSEADINAAHVRDADEAFLIGPAPALESYLNIDKVISVAKESNADAIHPGYGFLSENADFSRACADAGLVFVGPSPSSIETMGSKSLAKSTLTSAGIPLIPGYHGQDQSLLTLKREADNIGYPVLIKAVAGGGGKGMRVVNNGGEFNEALESAKREAASSFANDEVILEKYLEESRHIEIQVFCDQQGNAVYLFERDCSVQRRHQKIIEEAPAPRLSNELRKKMGAISVKAAKAIEYLGAGTIEFLLDPKNENFYFMEMNTRLQVEHPVTEMITGIDMVAWQILVAAGEKLPKQQEALKINGHAIETRIYAEDPENNFFPESGCLSFVAEPNTSEYLRVDTGITQGDNVSVYYDPMLAKLVSWGETRQQAITRLLHALSQYAIYGVKTNIDYLQACLVQKKFSEGLASTTFIENFSNDIKTTLKNTRDQHRNVNLALMAYYFIVSDTQGKTTTSEAYTRLAHWRLNSDKRILGHFDCQGENLNISYTLIRTDDKDCIQLYIDEQMLVEYTATTYEDHINVEIGHRRYTAKVNVADVDTPVFFTSAGNFQCSRSSATKLMPSGSLDISHSDELVAPMNGRIIKIFVDEGVTVNKDEELLVLEAMKMEHTIRAPRSATIQSISCDQGQLVQGGNQLIQLKAQSEE